MQEYYDVIIVGTGAAGLFCALHIPEKYKVLLITKDHLEKSNSYLAQGGISTLKNSEDYNLYFEDTLKAGKYKNDVSAVNIMIQSSNEIINKLISLGVEFDQDNGHFSLTREGAHSTNRIMHHQDITGKEIICKLIKKVQQQPNITIKTHHTLLDILTKHNTCTGVIVEYDHQIIAVHTKIVVLATGGLGGLFENSTNFKHITGDGFAIALTHNITLKDIHSIQIHPSCLYTGKKDRRFLISEAVRGEGAYLLNSDNQRFVDELLPRDLVSSAILDQMSVSGSNYVSLSAIHLGEEKIKKRFPTIYQTCLEEGYDMTKDFIPITPAQHYCMGGLQVDTSGRTSMNNLFAIGETSCSGVHGANRLASNSLLESLVFAKRAAFALSSMLTPITFKPQEVILSSYNCNALREHYKTLVLKEIKRKDEIFYAKWCDKKYQCG